MTNTDATFGNVAGGTHVLIVLTATDTAADSLAIEGGLVIGMEITYISLVGSPSSCA